jgi:hypothetical protein
MKGCGHGQAPGARHATRSVNGTARVAAYQRAGQGASSFPEPAQQKPTNSHSQRLHPLNTLYVTNGDYVHITLGDASGHGWWEKISGTATTAKVTIWLEEYLGGTWYVEATGTYTGGPGPGSGKWANARYTCIPTSSKYLWRSRIDVDIIGEQDGPEQAITDPQSLNCL